MKRSLALLAFGLLAAGSGAAAAPGTVGPVSVVGAKDGIFPPLAEVVVEHVADVSGISPHGLAIDGDDLYYAEAASGTIKRMPKKGGKPVIVAERRPARDTNLLVQGKDLFWLETIRGRNETMKVVTVPKRGGSARVLFDGVVGEDSLAVDATAVWFSTGEDWRHPNQVVSVPRQGPAAVKQLAELQGTVCSLALDDRFVYASQCDENLIVRIPRGGGRPETLAHALGGGPYRLTICKDRIIYNTRGHEGIWQLPKKGGSPAGLSFLATLTDFYVADDDDQFFIPTPLEMRYTGRDATLVWIKRDPKFSATLDAEMDRPGVIALDPVYVYWLRKDKELVRARRKLPLNFLPEKPAAPAPKTGKAPAR